MRDLCKFKKTKLTMEAIKVKIKTASKKKYEILGNEIDFDLLENKIRNEIMREQFDRTVEAAKKAGLSKMTNKEINTIIKKVRKGA